MSSTRHAAPGSGFNQERYASSLEDESRLLANLVARRCQAAECRAEVEAIMFIQWHSHQEGGLKPLARALEKQLLAGDPAYVKHRREWPQEMEDVRAMISSEPARTAPARRTVAGDPRPGEDEDAICEALMDFCLNPRSLLWDRLGASMPLVEVVNQAQSAHREECGRAIVKTEIARQVMECLDYALGTSSLVLIEGDPRTGKSFAAKNWCRRRPGIVRYVQVPSSNDEKAFHRKIAEAVGVSCSASKKGLEIRERVEIAVQGLKLMLVLDEAHYLWPQVNTRVARPKRINWIMTELVNYGVPVALISTPQFTSDQQRVEKNTGWTSGQFIGRIAHYRQLPGLLSKSDLEAVARFHLPEGSDKSIQYLARYAEFSKSYVAGIEHVVRRARFEANLAGDDRVKFSHLDAVVSGFALPSDSALIKRLEGRGRRGAVPLEEAVDESPSESRPRVTSTAFSPIGERAGNLVASS
jgi:hypothetical protein